MRASNSPAESTQAHSGREAFVMSRLFEAPRKLVWKAWTQRQAFDTGHQGTPADWPGTLDQLSFYLAEFQRPKI